MKSKLKYYAQVIGANLLAFWYPFQPIRDTCIER